MPPGILIFEDPPQHTVHRGLLSRVFTPKRMNALEPKVREFCARALDPLVGAGALRLRRRSRRPDADAHDRDAARHPRVRPGGGPGPRRRLVAHRARRADGRRRPTTSGRATFFADYVDWRVDHPSDDLMTDLLQRRVRGRDGNDPPADPRRGAHVRERAVRRGERDHQPPHRLDGQGAGRAPRPAARAGRGPLARAEHDRGAPALRAADAPRGPVRDAATSSCTARRCPAGSAMLCLSGSANRDERQVPRRRPLRHPPPDRPAPHVRLRHPLLPRRRARPPRGPGRPRRGAARASPSGTSTGTTPGGRPRRRCGAGSRCR